ncbi:hypothetical protein [Microbulbifer sp. SAOS-129_SWC]|uniref:FliH/SctL family protein n=1 Tax=Microbulbifer sp. SAOS-129_SWC TaxID=3145235 RepID=UPI003216F384
MSEMARKKLLGAEHNSSAVQSVNSAKGPQKVEAQTVDVDAILKKIELQKQEIESLRGDLAEKTSELSRLSTFVEDNEKKYYQEAVARGREEGLKSYTAGMERMATECSNSIASLERFLHETASREKSFIQENVAGVVAISVAKIVGDIKIPPNYLYEKIAQLIEFLNPEKKVDIQIGANLYEALISNKAVFDRLNKLARITCNSDIRPFDLLIEAEDQVVDAGYSTQIGNLHSLIAEALA